MSIEAMKQALEALESINELSKPPMNIPLAAEIDGAMDALRQAIEQAEQWDTSDMAYRPNGLSVEQEPVAWLVRDYVDGFRYVSSTENPSGTIAGLSEPLYTAPPKRPVKSFSGGVPWYATDAPKHEDDDIQEYKKPWVGLTDEEISNCWINPVASGTFTKRNVYEAIEAKLKEKNHD
jgi:hypothetical protein